MVVLLAGFGNTKRGRKETGKEGGEREKEKGKGRESIRGIFVVQIRQVK
jgi:hypothetical protein